MRFRPIYILRQVLNGAEILDWYRNQGVRNLRNPAEMHLNIMHCMDSVDWDAVGLCVEPMILSEQGTRYPIRVKGTGSTGIGINSEPLITRWLECIRLGCTWRHSGYHPHVATTHAHPGLAENETKMYLGQIILGPELRFDPNHSPV